MARKNRTEMHYDAAQIDCITLFPIAGCVRDRAVPSKTECRPCRCLLGNFNKGNLVFGIDPGYKNAESEIFKFFR